MRSKARLSVLAAVTAVAATAFAVPAAYAQTSATCAITGTASVADTESGSVNGGIPAMPFTDPLDGLSDGTYSFTQFIGECLDSSGGAGNPFAISVTDGSGGNATGWYDNLTCGTGNATSDPGKTEVAGLPGGAQAIDYEISFVGGKGVFTVTSGATGGGVININPIPNPTSPLGPNIGCVTNEASGFDVEGVITVVY